MRARHSGPTAAFFGALLAAGLASSPFAAAGSLGPPLPPPRPDRIPAVDPPPDPPASPEERAEDGDAASEAARCFARLAELGVRFERAADRAERSCAAKNVVLLTALPGSIAVSPASPMVCAVAEALAEWSAEVVGPKAEEHLKERPTKLVIGTSYECRNQRSGGKLSEHAFGNAVDLMSFGFSNRAAVPVGSHPAESAEARFQDEVRRGACPYFTTVLGPGSDAAHADHLHFDLRARNRGYRICQGSM
jgi:hypothetical protein